jgi:cytochrome c oxidase assembly protein subunit 15
MTRLSAILVVLTFLLVFMGGQVTTTDSGDSVPSWPASFFIPKDAPQVWELGHRWFAATVGALTVALAIWVLARERRSLPRKLAIAAAVLVVVQAIVGGVRVLKVDKHVIAVVHALLAQGFLACVVALASALRRSAEPAGAGGAQWPARRAFALAIVTWIQAGLGAILRHETRTTNRWGLVLHLAGAFLVIVFAVRLIVPLQERLKGDPRFVGPSRGISLALVLQLILGLSAWATTHTSAGYVNPSPTSAASLVPTLHLVVGAAILALAVMMGMRGSLPVAPVTGR